MDGYVSKPLQAGELYEVIEDVASGEPKGAGQKAAETATAPGASSGVSAVVNLAAALERTGGDMDLLRELAGVFCTDCPRMLAHVRIALDERDGKRLKEAAHALKGAVGVFDPAGAYATALSLESLDVCRDQAGAEQIFLRLQEQIDRLVPALEELSRVGSTP
jgi:protein-histidine pros-kinase